MSERQKKALAESFLLRKKSAFEIASGTGPENDGLYTGTYKVVCILTDMDISFGVEGGNNMVLCSHYYSALSPGLCRETEVIEVRAN